MTKKKNTTDAPQALQPVSIAEEQLPEAATEIEVPAGHVYIVALNADGTEKENSGFFYPEKSYLRYYGNEAKYSVKKKHFNHL